MADRPILFSAPMVRALLAGAKTQTRRVLKQATGPSLSVGIDDDAPGVAELSWLWGDGPGHDVHETIKRVPCPYGRPGEKLWVRETWAAPHRYDHLGPSNIPVDGVRTHYAASEDRGGLRWRPSIHMPRWASRITLEVTGVRVERLQDISEADAIAEGVTDQQSIVLRADGSEIRGPVAEYVVLWEQINGPGSWDANPWVWCVEFRRVQP